MWSEVLPVVVPAFGVALLVSCTSACCLARRLGSLQQRVETLEARPLTAMIPQPVRYFPSPPPPPVYYMPPAPSAPAADFPRLV